jgi:hypothetical protein
MLQRLDLANNHVILEADPFPIKLPDETPSSGQHHDYKLLRHSEANDPVKLCLTS